MSEGIRRHATRDITVFAKGTNNTCRCFRPFFVDVAVVVIVVAALKIRACFIFFLFPVLEGGGGGYVGDSGFFSFSFLSLFEGDPGKL